MDSFFASLVDPRMIRKVTKDNARTHKIALRFLNLAGTGFI